jgi:hypothetical protein
LGPPRQCLSVYTRHSGVFKRARPIRRSASVKSWQARGELAWPSENRCSLACVSGVVSHAGVHAASKKEHVHEPDHSPGPERCR